MKVETIFADLCQQVVSHIGFKKENIGNGPGSRVTFFFLVLAINVNHKDTEQPEINVIEENNQIFYFFISFF